MTTGLFVRAGAVTLGVAAQQLVDARGGTDGFVGGELQHGRAARLHLAGDLGLQTLAVLAEGFDDLGVALLAGHRIEVHDATVHFGVDVDGRDRHQRQTIVVDLGELVGDDLAVSFAQSRGAFAATTCIGPE